MKASFVRDGFLHLPGAVDVSLVAAALLTINAQLGRGPDAWEMGADGPRLGGGVQSSAAITELLYASPAFGLAEQLLGRVRRIKRGQVALRFPSSESGGCKGEGQWHIAH